MTTNHQTLADLSEQELIKAEAETAASLEYARSLGLQLPDIILDLSEWITIKRYSEKYGMSTQSISNKITRGTIPANCIQEVPELNNMKLIKDQIY
jgi:hypothetical protein